MDYNTLLDMTAELGYKLAMSGAETYRIEESVVRVMAAYGIRAEAFAIPNCLHVSIETDDGQPMTRMRRIGHHGNDLDAVEKYSNVSRRICTERPEPKVAYSWVRESEKARKQYPLPVYLAGNFLGACGFAVLFGGNFVDSICAGLCGIVVGLVNNWMDSLKVNPFFRTIAASFFMALLAYFTGLIGIASNTDAIIIGALMILVPGLIFTNAMRDIIYGDTNSGINRIVQVLLIAAAIALGTGAAWGAADTIWGVAAAPSAISHSLWIEIIACFASGIGFSILFNIHGPGCMLCALGGVLTWFVYRIATFLGCGSIMAYFWGTVTAAVYSEIMARIRKYPAISYLVISIFPLIPGAGVYYTMQYITRGDMASFASQGTYTAAIAGAMAVGILLVSTVVRHITVWLYQKRK